MRLFLIFLSLLYLCNAAPAPEPAPSPVPAPDPSAKADPSLVYATPIFSAPAVSYSTFYRAPPLYTTYTPYVYKLGYASAYSYGAYPYYVL